MKKNPYEEKEVVNHYLSSKNLIKTRTNFHISTEKLKEILAKEGIFPSVRKTTLNIKYFEKIDTAEKAYWLGFIAADGCIHKHGYKLSFCLKDTDIDLLLNFKKAINSGSPVTKRKTFDKRTNKTYFSCTLQINSKEFCQHIRNHGVNENKSSSFYFPKINEIFYSHFIRGLYDGDGGLFVRTSKIRKKTTLHFSLLSTLECLSFIKDYLEKNLKLTVQKIRQTQYKNLSLLSIQKDINLFLNWIYLNSTVESRLYRKYNKFIENS